MTKQIIAIAPQARKSEARNGCSITKNMITPEISARMLAIIAIATHPRLICAVSVIRTPCAPRPHLRAAARLLEIA